MNEGDLIKVLQELKVYSQTWTPTSNQNFSCQTDFEELDDNNNNIPFIYCSQFSEDGHAETQCNIPLSRVLCKSCAKVVPVEDATTQCDFPSRQEAYSNPLKSDTQRYNKAIKCEIEDDPLSLPVPSALKIRESRLGKENTPSYGNQPDLISFPLKKETYPYNDNSRTDRLRDAVNDEQNKKYVNRISSRSGADSYDVLEDFDDHHNDEAMEEDNINNEAVLRKKFRLSETMEEDKLFWADMKEKSKHNKAGSKSKRKKHLHVATAVKKKNIGNGLQKERTTKDEIFRDEGDMTDDDWITDDEEEEKAAPDFTVAFKDEWRKKRVPAHTHEKNYVCDVCNKPYSKSHYLRDHIVRDHSDHDKAKEYPFRCQHCKRVYNGQKQLDYHQSLHNGPCEICGVMFGCGGLFWNHRKSHDAVCDICDKAFTNLRSLSTHKKIKHERKRFFCNICDKGFTYQSMLKMHTEKAHSWISSNKQSGSKELVKAELRDLNCEECSYIAKNEQSLRVHQGMAHRRKKKKAGNKVYSCPICNAELTSKVILKKHVDKHLIPYPTYKCTLCNKIYTTSKKLESHRRKVHSLLNEDEETQELHIISGDQEIYSCRSCESSFVTPYALQEHMSSVHGMSKKFKVIAQDQILYECVYCSSNFESTDALQAHILSVHSVPHTASREIVQVASDSLHVTGPIEEYPVMEINLSNRAPGSPESRVISGTFEIPMETSVGNFDTRTTVSLPACAVPADVNMVEIDGVKYHVIRNGQ